jgi:YVTN family beta-propeller protein
MMSKRWLIPALAAMVLLVLMLLMLPEMAVSAQGGFTPTPRPLYAMPDPNTTRVSRSNVIALAGNQRYAVTANTFSGTASIIDIADKRIVAELPVGDDPRALVVSPDQTWMAVTSRQEGTVSLIDLDQNTVIDTMWVGLWPWGVVTDGTTLYVALQGDDLIVEVDVVSRRVLREMAVPDAPAGLALWGDFLYITHFETGALSLLYIPTGQVAATVPGSPDSRISQAVWVNRYDGEAYIPAMRANPDNPALTFDTTVFPVVNVFSLRNMGAVRRERVALDVADRPVSMPFDVGFDRARRLLWVVNAGSNDVSVIDMNTGLARANIPVGTNPRGLVAYADWRFVFVYNALDGTISVIETAFMEEVDKLAATELDMPIDLLLGAQFFYGSADDRFSEDRRLSCATCHFDGADDGLTWVGFPGGSRNTPLLYNVRETLPWGWHAQYDELADFDSYYRSVQHGDGLMDGPMNPALGEPNAGRSPDLDSLVAYLNTLEGPGRNALRIPLTDVLDGEVVWLALGCEACHAPPLYADGISHDLGRGAVNTPSLRWVWDSAPYYYDGRATTLFDVFRVDEGPHSLVGRIPLADIDRLITYLRSLPLE